MKKGDKARQEILDAGIRLWHYDPSKVNARNIARLIGKTHPAVYHHFPKDVKKIIAAYGVRIGDSVVIVSLMLTNDPLVANLTESERRKHLNALRGLDIQSTAQDIVPAG